jgi:membrane protein
MVVEALNPSNGTPGNVFIQPLRRLPRRARLAFIVGHRVLFGFIHHDGLSWAAAMAFWLVLSLPPLVIGVSSVAGAIVGREAAQELLSEQIVANLPAEGNLIRELAEREIGLTSMAGAGSLILLLFSGSRVFSAMVNAINVMWRHVEPTGLVRRELMRLVLVVAVGGTLLTSVALQLGILGAADDLGELAGILTRFVLPFVIVVLGLSVTYRVVPRARATWKTALLGAVTAAILLRVAQLIFTTLLGTVMDFETGYGPLAGVAVLMTWAVVASAVVLLGAELVATLDRHRVTHLPLPSSASGEPEERPR